MSEEIAALRKELAEAKAAHEITAEQLHVYIMALKHESECVQAAKAALTKYGDHGAFKALRDANDQIDKMGVALAEAHSMVTAHESTIVKQENELAEAKAALEKYWNVAVEAQAMCTETHAALKAANARIANQSVELESLYSSVERLRARAGRAEARIAELEGLEADALQCASVEADLRREYKSRAERAEAKCKALLERVVDAETALSFWDRDGNSEYWLRHPARAALNPSPAGKFDISATQHQAWDGNEASKKAPTEVEASPHDKLLKRLAERER